MIQKNSTTAFKKFTFSFSFFALIVAGIVYALVTPEKTVVRDESRAQKFNVKAYMEALRRQNAPRWPEPPLTDFTSKLNQPLYDEAGNRIQGVDTSNEDIDLRSNPESTPCKTSSPVDHKDCSFKKGESSVSVKWEPLVIGSFDDLEEGSSIEVADQQKVFGL